MQPYKWPLMIPSMDRSCAFSSEGVCVSDQLWTVEKKEFNISSRT
jgi:hypothetical protein